MLLAEPQPRGDLGLVDRPFQSSSFYSSSEPGGISGTVVDIRLILREALARYATGIFIGHNHPRVTTPSPQDTNITKKLKEAARWMDIVLLDHIIVCGDTYYSFADEGII